MFAMSKYFSLRILGLFLFYLLLAVLTILVSNTNNKIKKHDQLASPTIQFVLPVISFCILVIAPITLLFDRIGLEAEEEDVELCAAFKTAMAISPAILKC